MQLSIEKGKYLGHVIIQYSFLDGLLELEKIEYTKKYPVPRNVNGVRAIMGLVNWYRSLIPNFLEISPSLINLKKMEVKSEISQDMLDLTVKLSLAAEPRITFLDFEQSLIVFRDASVFLNM